MVMMIRVMAMIEKEEGEGAERRGKNKKATEFFKMIFCILTITIFIARKQGRNESGSRNTFNQ